MEITPIPDKEAAQLLSVSYSTIRNAVKRGDLTRFPRPGLVQYVIKEQILLFHGKTQLKLTALNREEYETWEELKNAAHGNPHKKPVLTQDLSITEVASILIALKQGNAKPKEESINELYQRLEELIPSLSIGDAIALFANIKTGRIEIPVKCTQRLSQRLNELDGNIDHMNQGLLNTLRIFGILDKQSSKQSQKDEESTLGYSQE